MKAFRGNFGKMSAKVHPYRDEYTFIFSGDKHNR